jgi:hypothetical protein
MSEHGEGVAAVVRRDHDGIATITVTRPPINALDRRSVNLVRRSTWSPRTGSYASLSSLAVGLVTETVEPGRALARAWEIGAAIGRKSGAALTWAKRAARGVASSGVDDLEEDCFAEVWRGDDWREGIEALLARRAPAFSPPAKPAGGLS